MLGQAPSATQSPAEADEAPRQPKAAQGRARAAPDEIVS